MAPRVVKRAASLKHTKQSRRRPELQRRGLSRTEYEGRKLRENLGLPRPENRYAAETKQIPAVAGY
jgi:hypothetical protein